MQKLVIVCGLPASGKTTLANALSKKLDIVCLHKDTIKEILYESFKFSSLDNSKQLGVHSIGLLYGLAEEQLKNGVNLIIEAPFYFMEDYKLFRNWEKKYKIKIFSIVCSVDKKTRDNRFTRRDRHRSHRDIDRLIMKDEYNNPKSEAVYKKLPGKIIKIHTDKPASELVKELIKLFKKKSLT